MPATTALLDRTDELEAIERALDTAADGQGGVLTFEGEAGAGKSSLLDATAGLAKDRGMRVLSARGGEHERDFPYAVVRQLFEPLLAGEQRREELLTGAAALAAPAFGSTAGQGDPFGIQHGIYWLVADLAAAAPLTLVVDDAHWADPASLRTLAYVAHRLADLPVVVTVGVRVGEPGAHHDLLDELRRESGQNWIHLRPLGPKAASQLVERELGERPSERFAEACHVASAGNAFLLVELSRALASERVRPSEESAGRLEQIAAGGVASSILVRLARLGQRSVDVARAVAILEPNAETRLVAALADMPFGETAAACDALITARLLADRRPLAFAHPLVRAAVYADMAEPLRATAHARAARLLGEDDAPMDAVAAHLLLAEPGGDESVVADLRAAAEAALGRGAPESAVSYLRRALSEPPHRPDRPAVKRELGSALLRTGDREGIEVLAGVRANAEDPVIRAELAAELSVSMAIRGGTGAAASLLEESIGELDAAKSPSLLLTLRAAMVEQTLYGRESVPDQALPDARERLTGGDIELRRLLGATACLTGLGFGSMRDARIWAERATDDRAGVIDDAAAGRPPGWAVATLAFADRGELGSHLFDPTIEAIGRRGIPNAVAMVVGSRALCRLAEGRLPEGGADGETALDLSRPSEDGVGPLWWAGCAIEAMVERGELAAADELLARHDLLADVGRGCPGAFLLCRRGQLRRAMGRHADAREDFLAAAERVTWLPYANPELLGWRLGLAQVEAVLGERDEAERLAAEAVALARKAEGERGIGVALRVQGIVVGDASVELLHEAVEILAGTRARLQHAHALVDLGAALRRANKRRDARAPLRDGLDLAHRCGALALELRARTELAATGARPRKALLTGVESLTPSELRIARLATEGLTNREIAQQLFVSAKTVETHLRHSYQKLDVSRRTDLTEALERTPA